MLTASSAGLERRIRFALATSDRVDRGAMAVAPLRRGAEARARRYAVPDGEEPALALAARLAAGGFDVHLDRFGELVADEAAARAVGDAYVALAGRLAALPDRVHLALDPSNLGLDVAAGLFGQQLARIAAALPAGRTITVGAEDARRTDAAHDAVLRAAEGGAPVTMTLQANLRRSPADADRLAAAGVPVRLVKGAYVEPIARAHAYGDATDAAFVALAERLTAAGAGLRLATHDPALRDRLLATTPAVRVGAPPALATGVEMLLGVRGSDALALRDLGVPVGLYVPFGDRWLRYLLRRRAEAVGG